MQKIFVVLLGLVFIGCDYRVMFPASPSGPSITNNNTNTNTNTVDISDLVNFAGTFPPTTQPGEAPTPNTPLPIPANAESTARSVSTASVGKSCQNFDYLDAVVSALRRTDQRWGYVCNAHSGCPQVSGDTIGYRATNSNTGLWAVDIIVNHCGTNPSPAWNVVGYAADRQWTPNR